MGVYLKVRILELHDDRIHSLFETFSVNGVLKSELSYLEEITLHNAVDISNFFQDDWVIFLLSRVHNQYMFPNKPYKIT